MSGHSLLLFLIALALSADIARGQWVNESYPLKAGWNAVWLSHDPSLTSDPDKIRTIGEVLNAYPQIVEVWRWNPLGSTVQFIENPQRPVQGDTDWAVWRRGDPANSTLGTLTGNSAYLFSVSPGDPDFVLQLTGRPLVPGYKFSSDGLNFLGFPSVGTKPFTTYLSNDSNYDIDSDIFAYIDASSGVLSMDPVRVNTPDITPMARGQAYWINGGRFSEFYGPLKVTILGSGGIDFGRKLNTVTVRVKNVTNPARNRTVTANFSLSGSESPPDGGPPAPTVPLRVRGPRDGNLQFTYSGLPAALTLAPGEEIDLVLDAHRSLMTVPDQSYQAVLTVSDSLGHSRIDLPVSATGSSTSGIWIGAAVLDSVNRVETISGPEFDAPIGTPNGESPETRKTVTTTDSTSGGQTTRVTAFDLDFDANGDGFLPGGGLPLGSIKVSGPSGSPVYMPGTDYTVDASSRAMVTELGSNYTLPPDVSFEGGGGSGASAVASLSASVRAVEIIDGGSGYTSAPTVEISDGGGSGAIGEAVFDAATGLVTAVILTDRGSGYSSAPLITFTGGGGDGALAEAAISGGIGSVIITAGGSGYTGPPVVSITAAAGDTSGGGAEANVEVRGGVVAGVDVIRREAEGGIGDSARIELTSQAVADAGARDGTVVSNVISISKLVTLNGKSHLSTRRISTGEGAAAPSLFTVRLILHAPPSGAPTLLQQVYLGQRGGQVYAGPAEEPIHAIVKSPGETSPGEIGRVSSANFPRGEWWAGSGSFDSSASFSVVLGHNAETNPFVHTYHPDHDNWDARYESPLPAGVESYAVTRDITLNFDQALPAGVSDLGWGVTTVGGIYTEVIRGLRSEEIAISGRFILNQVSEVPVLTTP